jgi:hypothetical protein
MSPCIKIHAVARGAQVRTHHIVLERRAGVICEVRPLDDVEQAEIETLLVQWCHLQRVGLTAQVFELAWQREKRERGSGDDGYGGGDGHRGNQGLLATEEMMGTQG